MLNPSNINCLIVDDEEDARRNVAKFLSEHFPSLSIEAEAENALEAATYVEERKIDLIFLDISMPVHDGFQFLEMIPNYSGEVVFITSYNEYAENAFRYLALGYITKPIDIEDFVKVVNKATAIIVAKKNVGSYKQILELLGETDRGKSKVVFPTQTGFQVIDQEEIYYVEADRNYSNVFYGDKKLVVSKNLRTVENWLEKRIFLRVHRSILVNINKIVRYDNEGILELNNGSQVRVSKGQKGAITEMLQYRK